MGKHGAIAPMSCLPVLFVFIATPAHRPTLPPASPRFHTQISNANPSRLELSTNCVFLGNLLTSARVRLYFDQSYLN